MRYNSGMMIFHVNLMTILVIIFSSFCSVGCDGIAGSQRRLDRCGVCGGDNSTCRVVSGIFTRPQMSVGYNIVAHIPRGACNLNITQIRKSPNYLALRTAEGNYILNGNWAISWPGEYEGAGAKFLYTRQDVKSMESIASSGPLREPVDLLVLYQQPNPGIKYEYMLPMNDAPLPPLPADTVSANRPLAAAMVATPKPSSNSPANLMLSNGLHTNNLNNNPNVISSFIPKSGSGSGGTPIYLAGDSSSSYSIPSSATSNLPSQHPHLHNHHGRRRNHHRGNHSSKPDSDKKFYWKVTGYTDCSDACGGGTQRSVVRCVRGQNGVPVSDRRCNLEDKPLGQTRRCNLKPCPAEWITGPWSSCSDTCGEGFQTRTVHCQQKVSPNFTMRVAEGACLDTQPEARKPCFLKPCHRWETSAWSQCSQTCGNGIRKRSVNCLNPSGEKIDSNHCDASERPQDVVACNMGPCEGVDWFVSDWSEECSAKCGGGVQTRHVTCGGINGNGRRKSSSETETNLVEDEDIIDEENSLQSCDDNKKPSDERECFTERHCSEPVWYTSEWGECSVTCGQGFRTRSTLCVLFSRGKFKVVEESLCSSSNKPEDRAVCEKSTICPPRWFTSNWGECSVSCGGGVQKRSVSCRASNMSLPSSNCLDSGRPLDRRSCNEHKCTTTSSGGDSNGQTAKDQLHDEARPQAAAQVQPQSPTSPSLSSSSSSSASSHSHHVPSDPNDETEVSDGECTDQYRNCPLVVQARLCRYKYYRSVCCSACTE